MPRYKITVEYDGSPFFGWQRQAGVCTVQQRLEEAILPISKVPVVVYGSGRTDTGVHALAQVAHFDLCDAVSEFRIQECMNAYLRDVPIGVLAVEMVSSDFDARFSAVERRYVYKILNRRTKACLDANKVWKVTKALNADEMNTAAQCLVGKHDFSSFRAAGCQSNSPVKTLNSISVKRVGELILIDVAARSFLYHQVRNIVGSLAYVGDGRWSVDDFKWVLNAKDRKVAGMTAPACGLYFAGVSYE